MQVRKSANCVARRLDVPITFGVDIAFVSGNGTPTERVLSVQGRELHRCQIRPAKLEPRPANLWDRCRLVVARLDVATVHLFAVYEDNPVVGLFGRVLEHDVRKRVFGHVDRRPAIGAFPFPVPQPHDTRSNRRVRGSQRDSTPNQSCGARLGVLIGWGLLLPVFVYPLRRSSFAGRGARLRCLAPRAV